MFVAGAVCPHPPLLVPEVAAGAAGELESLRASCSVAIGRLLENKPKRVVIVGDSPVQATYGSGAVADFSPYGVDLQVTLGQAGKSGLTFESAGRHLRPRLPLSLSIGAWLLREVGFGSDVTAIGVPATIGPDDAAALGHALLGVGERVAILAMGDGSARSTTVAPGYVDPRAAAWNESVGNALAAADTDSILGLDQGLASTLMCAGRASWQVLAGAAAGYRLQGDLLYDDAPYGVGYFVATWTR